MDKEQLYKSRGYLDTAIIVIDTKKLREDEAIGILQIELEENENFERGIEILRFITVNISGAGFAQIPNFWTINSMTNYGGDYLSIKAEKFVELNGITDGGWKAPNMVILYAYCKKTYLWFEENPTFDKDGNRIHFKGSIEY